MSSHVVPASRYFNVYLLLMVLLAVTVLAAHYHIGPEGVQTGNVIVAMVIAAVKAVTVVLEFMHVRYSTKLTWLWAGAGFLWLLILFGLTIQDYISRPWLKPAGY